MMGRKPVKTLTTILAACTLALAFGGGIPGAALAADPGRPVWDAAANFDVEKLRELLASGAPVNLVYDNRTPLISALEFGSEEMARLLLEHGADPNIPAPPCDVSPLSIAITKRQRAIAHLLIAKGSDVNAVDRRGKTPLLYAAAASESELVRALVEAGADIDFRDRSGATPTWYAAGFGDFAATRTLVEAGAQLDITGNCYKWGKQECTAAEVARFKQFYDIAKYLEEKAAAKGTEVAPAASGEAKP